MKRGVLLVLVIAVAFTVSASFSVGDPSHSIQDRYSVGSNIIGWINMSFSSEP
jgi:hypothetical protein